jgi:hypothetical protein
VNDAHGIEAPISAPKKDWQDPSSALQRYRPATGSASGDHKGTIQIAGAATIGRISDYRMNDIVVNVIIDCNQYRYIFSIDSV